LSLERAKTDTQTDRAQGFEWKKQRAKTQQQEKKGGKKNTLLILGLEENYGFDSERTRGAWQLM
jgi:hypothetical protein